MPDLLTPIQRERLYGLTFRSLTPADQARYTPLELIPGRAYTETFNLDGIGPAPTLSDGDGPESESPFTAVFLGPDAKVCFTQPLSASGNQLQLTVDMASTVKLFAGCDRGVQVGEWYIFPGPLATGPISFKKPPNRDYAASWICISPFEPAMQEMVITLKGVDKGPYQDGTAYSQGDMVTIDGRVFYALCDTDGSPGSGPNLDPSDPDSNTLLPEHFPPSDAAATDTAAV